MPAGDQGFPKTVRLKTRATFIRMNRGARRLHQENFVFLWRPNHLPQSRLGVTVTKRVANAVGRNRVKRRLREAFRKAGERLPGGMDLVVVAKKGAPLLDCRSTNRQFYRALEIIREKTAPSPQNSR